MAFSIRHSIHLFIKIGISYRKEDLFFLPEYNPAASAGFAIHTSVLFSLISLQATQLVK